MPHDLVVMPQKRPLSGSVPAPPDEDLSHLALLVAALADGASELRRVSKGIHATALMDTLSRLGVTFDADAAAQTIRVRGRTLHGLVDPGGPLSCGRSVPTLSRLAAVLVAHSFQTVLTADVAQPLRGMTEVAAALRRRAAQIEGAFSSARAGELSAPFTVGPLLDGSALSGVEYELAGRRPDIKDALLLSGLYADEATYVREAIVSRDHLERMLQAIDVPVSAAGPIIFLDPAGWSGKIEAFSFDVPGDVGAATLLAGMATLVPGSRVCVRGVGLNATRTGVLDLLRQMGAERETTAEATRLGETEGTVCAAYAPLRAVPMTGELLLHARDDLPVLLALAARARGTTEIAGLNALAATDAFVESVSARGMVDLLHAFGIEAVSPDPDCIVVSGRPDEPLAAVDVDAEGGAARATTAIMLALLGNGPSRIRDADALAERFPRVVGTLRALGVDVRVEQRG